ncbi:MAG: hypothetical protein H3C35_03230 [Bacteroidetes bacterium]|nr:hypothetical protein [Bacteroidota bacterium]
MLNIRFKKSQYIIGNQVEFINYLKKNYPLFHMSNVFFRDLHYGVMGFLKMKKAKIGYTEAEQVTREVAVEFEKKNILRKMDYQTWLLNYPEFTANKAQ